MTIAFFINQIMEGFYEPSRRYSHCSAVAQGKWYNFGGKLHDGGSSQNVIEEFDPVDKVWKQHRTTGDFPPGYFGSAAASIQSKFYLFGGLSDEGYFNTLHELDIDGFVWTRLDPRNQDGICPIAKVDSAMISFDKRLLVTFGGKGISTAHILTDSLYASNPGSSDSGLVWTNELLCFDVTTSK